MSIARKTRFMIFALLVASLVSLAEGGMVATGIHHALHAIHAELQLELGGGNHGAV